MATLTKRARRAVKRVTLSWRHAIVDSTPGWAKNTFGPSASYLDMLFVDHGIFRVLYLNRHRLGDQAWRSAQPAPYQIAGLARRGIRTIVNLRGERLCGSFWLEQAACARHGIELLNFQLRSRAAPTRAEVLAARDLLGHLQYPVLFHCKSGADRVGLMSVLYRHVREALPISEAKRELSWRYGHIRQADTGILDRFFESYLEYAKSSPIEFFDWLETVYDQAEVTRTFKSSSWANRLVDGVLRRE